MADPKRQSINNKVATPKPGSQSTGDLSKEIGARVRVNLVDPASSIEGTIFGTDSNLNVIALNTTPAPPNPSTSIASQPGDYHVLPLSRIQSWKIIGPASDSDRLDNSLSGSDVRALKAREDAAVLEAKRRAARRGKGVGEEGQKIFDFLCKKLPTRWDGTSIVVNDAVIIVQPYRPEDCSAPSKTQNQLARIKKELEAARKKIGEVQAPSRDNKIASGIAVRKDG